MISSVEVTNTSMNSSIEILSPNEAKLLVTNLNIGQGPQGGNWSTGSRRSNGS